MEKGLLLCGRASVRGLWRGRRRSNDAASGHRLAFALASGPRRHALPELARDAVLDPVLATRVTQVHAIGHFYFAAFGRALLAESRGFGGAVLGREPPLFCTDTPPRFWIGGATFGAMDGSLARVTTVVGV
jgi:hypothetical protein